MDDQLSLLGDAVADETVTVSPTRAVLMHGASAREVPRHRDVGPIGSAGAETAARMLALAENALRYNQAPSPRLVVDPEKRKGLGSNGPMGANSLMADNTAIRDYKTGETATWPQLLRALAAQREDEPHIARARDLAHAYHYLSYYSRAYGTPADAPPALIASLRASITELGGDPDAVAI